MSKETGCAGGMADTHYDLLRYVADHPHCTNKDVMAQHGSDPRGYLRRLRSEGLIDGSERTGVIAFFITPAGKRLLAKLDGGMGDYPAPREPVSREQYTGERWNVRPGSEPAHGYRRPLLIASKVQANAGMARV